MNLIPPVTFKPLSEAEEGELICLERQNQPRYALVGCLKRNNYSDVRMLAFFGFDDRRYPLWMPFERLTYKSVLSFGKSPTFTCSNPSSVSLPGAIGKNYGGLIVRNDGVFLRCAPMSTVGEPEFLDFSIENGIIAETGYQKEFSWIHNWSLLYVDQKQGTSMQPFVTCSDGIIM